MEIDEEYIIHTGKKMDREHYLLEELKKPMKHEDRVRITNSLIEWRETIIYSRELKSKLNKVFE